MVAQLVPDQQEWKKIHASYFSGSSTEYYYLFLFPHMPLCARRRQRRVQVRFSGGLLAGWTDRFGFGFAGPASHGYSLPDHGASFLSLSLAKPCSRTEKVAGGPVATRKFSGPGRRPVSSWLLYLI
jgi:hypothetical protein